MSDKIEHQEIIEKLAKSSLPEKFYNDALRPSVSTAGEAINGVMKFVALPFSFLGMTVDELSKKYKTFISEAANTVPEDKLTIPKVSIIAPLLDNLKYVFDEEELKMLYSKLLACSMNCDITSIVHPAYVEVLKQMSPLDAKIFKDMFLRDDEILLERFESEYDRSFVLLSIDSFLRLGLITQETENESLQIKLKLNNFGCIFKNLCLVDNKNLTDEALKALVKEKNCLFIFDTNGEKLGFGLRVINNFMEYEMYHFQSNVPDLKSKLPALILTIVNNEKEKVFIDDIYIETEAKLDFIHKTKCRIKCDDFVFPCSIEALKYKNFIFSNINLENKLFILKNKKSKIKVVTGTVSYDFNIKDNLHEICTDE